MKAVINPGTGIWKNLTEAQYRSDQEYLEKDGFRLMTDKEIVSKLGYKPVSEDNSNKKTESKKAATKN